MTKTLKGESRDWLSPLFCWLYAAMLLWVLGLLTLGQRAMEDDFTSQFIGKSAWKTGFCCWRRQG